MGVALLQIKALTVEYAPENAHTVRALDTVDFELCRGQVIGVLGESGSGKSTLALALVRLLPETAEVTGSILFDGQDLAAARERDLRKIRGARVALIPQDPAVSLNPVIRIGKQISEVLRAHLRLNRKERDSRVRELLQEVGFDDIERIHEAYPHQLSGGQCQRVVIAQAIACRPDLIIADEPTTKLDPELQAQIRDLMSQIVNRHATSLLWITHDPAPLAKFADRIAVMYAGKIIEDGPAEIVLGNPLHPYTQGLIRLASIAPFRADAPRIAQHLPDIPGELPHLNRSAGGCRFEPRCTEKLEVCSKKHPRALSVAPFHLVSCFKYGN